MTSLTHRLRDQAHTLGLTLVGIAPAGPTRQGAAYVRWLDRGYHGEMGYLARPDAIDQRLDVRHRLPAARSVIVAGVPYAIPVPEPARLHDPARGRFARYAWGIDYHDVLKPRLFALDAWVRTQTGRTTPGRVSVDSAPVLERSWAQEAGLGFVGKNTCLIHPRQGSWLFLATLLVPEVLEVDEPPVMTTDVTATASIELWETPDSSHEPAGGPAYRSPRGPSYRFRTGETAGCGGCTRCLVDCPTQAFVAPYVLDARRCLSYLTIEYHGVIPRALRPAMGNWVFGCDVCQDVCPWNGRHAVVDTEQAQAWFQPDLDRAAPRLLDLLGLDDDAFRARFRGSPVQRTGRVRLVRNACVAAGNWADPQAVPALLSCLNDTQPLIRAHAAWALGRIDSSQARSGLRAAQVTETDDVVRAELTPVRD